jgi:hypothetical protein
VQRYFLTIVNNDTYKDFISSFFKKNSRLITLYNLKETVKYQSSGEISTSDLFILEYQSALLFAKMMEGFNDQDGNSICKIIVLINIEELADRDLQDFQSMLLLNQKVVGVIDSSSSPELSIPLLRSIISESVNKDLLVNYKMVLKKLSDELGSVVDNSLDDLKRVRKMHEYVVPLRKESIKGITISGKYAVGEASGGEFFDIVYNDSKLVLVLTTTDSYLASSTLLSLFSEFKDRGSFSTVAVEKFITDISEHFPKVGSDNVQLTILDIDLNTLKTNMFQFGNSSLFSNFGELRTGNELVVHPSFVEIASYKFQLEEGNKLLVISPGLNAYSNSFVGKEKLINYIQKRVQEMSPTFLNEIFFQLSKGQKNDFLARDASAIFIKVDLNVIKD